MQSLLPQLGTSGRVLCISYLFWLCQLSPKPKQSVHEDLIDMIDISTSILPICNTARQYRLASWLFGCCVFSHTLAQKHHCEFCCGVHRSCTKQSLQTDRKDWLTRRELQCEVCFLRPCSEEGSDVAEPYIFDRK